MVFTAYPEQQRDLRWVTVFLTSLATILLTFRVLSTIKKRGWLGLEDYFVIVANVFLTLLASCIYGATIFGFGKRVVDIKASGGNITKAMRILMTAFVCANQEPSFQLFWISQSWYTLTNGFNKMAFLALYYRIFPMPRFRKACLTLGAISAGWTIAFLFVVIFQCSPISRVYNRTIPGTCINFTWHRWSHATTNILTDIAIFILPIPVIIKLNMSKGSRIGLVVLFSMGFFICLTTALRMATLPLTLRTKEPSWESAPTNLWSFIEVAVGVICACLISLRNTVNSLWPKRWRSQKGSSAGQWQPYGSGGLASHGLGGSHLRRGTGTVDSVQYDLDGMKTGTRGKSSTYTDISPSESQERIFADAKANAHITMTRERASSTSGSEDLGSHGITVTTNVNVVRD